MKKKVKLITTFASLGLALALMVFGVYAATKVTLTTTSQVSFEAAAGVFVDAEWKVEGATEGTKTATYSTAATEVGDDSETLTLGAVTFSEANDTITYTLTITNQADAEYKFNVTLTDNSDEIPDGVAVTRTATSAKTATNVETYTYVITYELTDKRISVETLNVELVVVVEPGEKIA